MQFKTIFITLLLGLINLTELSAQQNILKSQNPLQRHFTTNEGLPSTTIYSMNQDQDGFIWIGTNIGVTRFDGINFKNYSVSDGLSDNDILLVRTDSKGRVWFLGLNGTVSYWFKGKIFNSSSDTLLKHITATNSFIDLYEDNNKVLWFISLDGYVTLDKNKIRQFDKTPLGVPGVVANYKSGPIFGGFGAHLFHKYTSWKKNDFKLRYHPRWFSRYLPLADGSILFLSEEGVIWQNDTIQKLILPFQGAFMGNILAGLALTKDSLLWFTAQGIGLYCYDLKNPLNSPKLYLKYKFTSQILLDREGNIWVSTLNDGLFMLPKQGQNVKIFNKENGLASDQCYSITKLTTGEFMVGMDIGKVNSIFQDQIFNIITYECPNPNNKVYRIISKNEDIWLTSEYGTVHLNNKEKCRHLINDPDHWNWHSDGERLNRIMFGRDMALGDNKVFIVNLEAKFEYPIKCNRNSEDTATRIRINTDSKNYSIYCDHYGQIWYGTTKGLKSIKDGLSLDHSNENILLTKRINSFSETKDSALVIATHGFGVLFYKKGKIVKLVTTADGLCSDICNRVLVFGEKVYVATPYGVSIIWYARGQIQSIQNLNKWNFLPSNQVYDIFVDQDDISVATSNGVAIISQKLLKKTESAIPTLSIEEIRINDSIISLNNQYKFSYRENTLKVKFIGINFQNPNNVNYRYRLKDNSRWEITANNVVEISFLPPGKYHFQLQARVQNGNWSPVKGFGFTITPPFWKTIWFAILILLITGSVVYLIIVRRLKKIKKHHEELARVEKQITELEQHALQTMMDPHFIFNVMNSIQHFINSNNKEAANQYLADFATLIRMNICISQKRFINLNDEIDYLNLYLSFEKLRFGDNLRYEIRLDPAIIASEATIAVMMIQPFIENAVWHGIAKLKTPGYIHVQINKVTEDLIRITIEDNGVGIDPKFFEDDFSIHLKEGHALKMTLQRLYLLEKSSGQKLYIRFRHANPEQANKGTIAELFLPAMYY